MNRKQFKFSTTIACLALSATVAFQAYQVGVLRDDIASVEYANNVLASKIVSLRADNSISGISTYLDQRMALETEFMFFEATAYDLSIDSCEKPLEHDWYGISANGFDMRGLSRKEAMSIAVDPTVIPLGSKLEIIFLEPDYHHFSGIYTANDVGGAIKGARIDVFMGDFNRGNELGMTPEVRAFGR